MALCRGPASGMVGLGRDKVVLWVWVRLQSRRCCRVSRYQGGGGEAQSRGRAEGRVQAGTGSLSASKRPAWPPGMPPSLPFRSQEPLPLLLPQAVLTPPVHVLAPPPRRHTVCPIGDSLSLVPQEGRAVGSWPLVSTCGSAPAQVTCGWPGDA